MTRTTRRTRASSSTPGSTHKRRHRYFTRFVAKRLAKLGRDLEGRRNLMSDEEHRNRMNLLKLTLDIPGKALGVQFVDFHKFKNGLSHHTLFYEMKEPVVRRGQDFVLTLKFDRDVNTEVDNVVLQFAFGSRPQESKGTILRLKLDFKEKKKVTSPVDRWAAEVQEVSDSEVKLKMTSPANALVGKYGLFVETKLAGEDSSLRRFEMEDDEFCVIFNPWCKDDLVYMPEIDDRYEYILNDHGRIWVGSCFNNFGRPWNFGQFDNPVLEAALTLMDMGEVGDSARRSPISFVRNISALANSNDDDGVLEGRWTGKYPGGTRPTAWTGSVKILEEFMSRGKPVKYGQCWIFSGIVTSLLRSLGIPTRSVTNFESAHDTDCSMTIDGHFDEDDEPATWLDDAVWNFHVWNESYFRRHDLPKGYDGWQAHDATPQELSEGVMCCGPAPLKAIKEGHVYLNYDVPFIFSEVNGDRVYWKVSADGEMTVKSIDSRAIGKHISTKAVGSTFRHDLTLDYKYPEGSEDERRVVQFVHKFSSRCEMDIYDKPAEDVVFKLVTPHSIQFGEDFQVKVRVKNTSARAHALYGRMTVLSSFYTGIPGKRVKGQPFKVDLTAGDETEFALDVLSNEYLSKLNPEASMIAYASFHVAESEQHFAQKEAFTLAKPFLDITVPDVIRLKEEVTGTVQFTNPLKVNLTNAQINLEGASVMQVVEHHFNKPIKPEETVSYDFKLCARREGNREIDATFTSDQLSGVDGSVEFNVQPAAPAADPVVADPVVADPVVADPVVADPVVADLVVADPVVVDPVVADPVVADADVANADAANGDAGEPMTDD